MLDPEISISGDGSHTVHSPVFNTLYHSHHGALSESMVVFIQAGLSFQKSNGYTSVSVFEMGFGTGLNALLAYQWAEENKVPMRYHTVEAFPLKPEVISKLNYVEKCGGGDIFHQLHQISWNQTHQISEYFTFKKYISKIEDLDIEDTYDVIFYDAFAPNTQSHLWEEPILSKMYHILDKNGVLVTFCAQGAFKRHLKSVGFHVSGIPGPPGKREITRAIKQ
jgi:tRNA U34 5-methylaminomethyl-2-thiouridine-forming methyltransferase MnmC